MELLVAEPSSCHGDNIRAGKPSRNPTTQDNTAWAWRSAMSNGDGYGHRKGRSGVAV